MTVSQQNGRKLIQKNMLLNLFIRINEPWKDDHDLHKALQLSLQECSFDERYAAFKELYYSVCFTSQT